MFSEKHEARMLKIERPLLVKTNPFLHADHVRIDLIPKKAPEKSTPVIQKHFPSDENGDGWILMVRDNSYAEGNVWVALEKFQADWSTGTGNLDEIMTGFISNDYDVSYLVRVFDGNDELTLPAEAGWDFNYDTGVLIFDSPRPESGNNEKDTIKIKAYRYTGRYLSDIINQISN